MVVGIIPARFSSTRFPGKPLVDLKGKTMIQRVYEQVSKTSSLDEVIVATDDQRIYDAVKSFGGEVMITSEDHESGTDRCWEVAKQLPNAEIIINIQGDEPLIDPKEIETLVQLFDLNPSTEIGTLIKSISHSEINNPNAVKVVKSVSGRALYFSRSSIPFERNAGNIDYFQHIGIYGYRKAVLEKITQLPVSKLEHTEGLEQLRWLENDFSIYTAESNFESVAIDSPEDVEKVLKLL